MTDKLKRALVTGGSGDIGEAICLKLAASGLHVIVHANKNIDKADAVVEKIKAANASAESISFDVTQQAEVQAAIEKILEQGPVQVLVNNAGIHQDAILAGMNPEQWNQVIDVNLNGFFNVTQPLLLPMMQTRWGRIINMSSIAGTMGNRGQANYAAAKAGIIGATKSLAVEVASRGITVNAVAPGIIAGSMTEDVFDKTKIKQLVPMNRTGTPEEVASLVNFLASDEAAYISSQVISINGAMT
ncbi:MAG: 3-oxoacyl-ACP reductase FabG [Gammaproteobacteria bacterium]|nr:3-oxoacyl-ACP reductase FabG [Gammaproteobacteria bacterium]